MKKVAFLFISETCMRLWNRSENRLWSLYYHRLVIYKAPFTMLPPRRPA